ncbi:MAG: TIGR03643 family protein [Saprospiraceae bacterium]
MKIYKKYNLTDRDVNRIVEMAWEDRTSFDAIKEQFGLSEGEVIKLMRKEMKLSSWKMWRKRVQGRSTKHRFLRGFARGRFKCSRQKSISHNKMSKR